MKPDGRQFRDSTEALMSSISQDPSRSLYHSYGHAFCLTSRLSHDDRMAAAALVIISVFQIRRKKRVEVR